jgi:predicted N-acetyltransferase YhbS
MARFRRICAACWSRRPLAGQGIGRRLVQAVLERSKALRVDVLAAEGSRDFYGSFPHHTCDGLRLHR